MTTFTDVMVEVADCHTTLYHLGATAPNNPTLPLSDSPGYLSLYAKIAAGNGVTYQSVTGQPGAMLKKLSPIFRKNDYWHHFFGSGNLAQYPNRVWEFMVPILCAIDLHVDPPQSAIRVSPMPYVVLYPFGWSNCLSLRLQGELELKDLADFNANLFASKPFTIAGAAASVRELFAKMSDGVRADAFGGSQANDFEPKDPIIVTTIMASYGGNLKLNGLSSSEVQLLLRIVKPEGPLPSGKLSDYIHRLSPNDKEKYVVMNNCGRFTWMEDRLVPVNRNYQHLRCNHNNTFNSILHARHLYQLLTQAIKLKPQPPSLDAVTKRASETLGLPVLYYKSASLRGFLIDADVAAAREKLEKLSQPKN
jgi:hypothetical protein